MLDWDLVRTHEMPGLTTSGYRTITVRELHPSFAAEVNGVNWNNVTDEQFDEIVQAMAKVRITLRWQILW